MQGTCIPAKSLSNLSGPFRVSRFLVPLPLPSECLVTVHPGSRYGIIIVEHIPQQPVLIGKAPIPNPFVLLSPDMEGGLERIEARSVKSEANRS